MRIGFDEEAANFTRWMQDRCGGNTGGQIQQMYTIDGDKEMAEEILDHLEGYKGSAPVRIGNAAYDQLQLDIYGELMDAAYLHNKYGTMISYDLWKNLAGMVDWVCENWHRKDEGIWEPRSGPVNNVYSKVMCWVALDRALRIAMKRSFPADIERWRKCRDTIYNEILEKGYNPEKQAFVQSYENPALDAANLIMPLVYFMSPADPRMINTLEAIKKPPSEGGLATSGLVYRYNNDDTKDGLSGEEGTFNICSFWLIEALTRAGRKDKAKLEEARLLFDKILGYSNHLGLFAEQTGPCGEALGNFPQAFTHIALISAAYNLNRQLGD
jgi:GH15 family glucan-1,4-alpha-glucosidase